MTDPAGSFSTAHDASVQVDTTPDPPDEERLAEGRKVGRQVRLAEAQDSLERAREKITKAEAALEGAHDAVAAHEAEVAAIEAEEV